MQYLIIFKDSDPFYTNWFDFENFWNDSIQLVFDLHNHKYTTNGQDWQDIKEDSL